MTVHTVTVRSVGPHEAEAVPRKVTMMRDDELNFVPGDGAVVHCTIRFHGPAPFKGGPAHRFEGVRLSVGRPKKKDELPEGEYAYDLKEVTIETARGPKAAKAVDPIIKIKDPPPPDP